MENLNLWLIATKFKNNIMLNYKQTNFILVIEITMDIDIKKKVPMMLFIDDITTKRML